MPGSTKLFRLFPKFPKFPGETACNGSKSWGLASGSGAEATEAVKQAMAWNDKTVLQINKLNNNKSQKKTLKKIRK